jgi:hypothetical protein
VSPVDPDSEEGLALLPQEIAKVEQELAQHRDRKNRSLAWALEEARLVDRLVAGRARLLFTAEAKHREQQG